jgi:rhodanese-related sulfurtransferase
MLIRALAVAAAFAFAGPFVATSAQACEAHGQTAQYKKITVEELAAMTSAKGAKVTVLDANTAETRAKFGVIPGAKLLSHFEDYDVSKELPADKNATLVFYCTSEKCSSAPTSAAKAMEFGYTNVFVLKSGIKGWKEAAKPTAQPPRV